MTHREPVFPAGRHALYDKHRYSAAIRSGDLLFVSGQVGSREDGSPEPDFEQQVRLAFDNLVAVLAAVTVMLVAATPLANFIERNPTIVMLALAFLLMIGTTLIAEGMGFHVPKGYVYAAMAFSALVEVLNMLSRNRRQRAHNAKH